MALSQFTRISILILLTLGLSACATTSAPQLTSLEIQAVQTREFEVSKDISFGAVVTVFQDLGYIIDNADKDSGFVTARSATKNTAGFFDFLAGVTSSTSTGVSAYIDGLREDYTRIRLNFVNATSKSGQYGQSQRADNIIYDTVVDAATGHAVSASGFGHPACGFGGKAANAAIVAACILGDGTTGACTALQPYYHTISLGRLLREAAVLFHIQTKTQS